MYIYMEGHVRHRKVRKGESTLYSISLSIYLHIYIYIYLYVYIYIYTYMYI